MNDFIQIQTKNTRVLMQLANCTICNRNPSYKWLQVNMSTDNVNTHSTWILSTYQSLFSIMH